MDNGLSPASYAGEYAGFVSRLIALVIDLAIISGVNTLMVVVASFLSSSFQVREQTQTLVAILVTIASTTFYISYFLVLWMLAGQTLGKAIMGIRIVRTNGERLNIGRAVIRLACYWLSAVLFLGYLWVLVDPRRQGFHDKLAGTLVIYADLEDGRQLARLRGHLRARRQRRQVSQGQGEL